MLSPEVGTSKRSRTIRLTLTKNPPAPTCCSRYDRPQTNSEMIKQPVTIPVALAPVGLTGMQRADGEIKAAKAAEEFGVPFTLSTMSICSIEDVAKIPTNHSGFSYTP